MKAKSLSHVRLYAIPGTVTYQAPPPMGFSRQEYWSGSPLPSPSYLAKASQLRVQTPFLWGQHELFHFQFSSVQLLSPVQLIATPWTITHQASLSITNSQILLKLMSIRLVMPSNHLVLCCPLLLLPSIFPSIFCQFSMSIIAQRKNDCLKASFLKK